MFRSCKKTDLKTAKELSDRLVNLPSSAILKR